MGSPGDHLGSFGGLVGVPGGPFGVPWEAFGGPLGGFWCPWGLVGRPSAVVSILGRFGGGFRDFPGNSGSPFGSMLA